MNKSGVFKFFSAIMAVAFIGFGAIFAYLFVFNIYTVELLPTFQNATIDVLEANGNNTAINNLITAQNQNIKNLNMPVDLLFFALWMGTTIVTTIGAYNVPRMGILQFLMFLFIGTIILLLFYNFLDQILVWLVTSFIDNTFSTNQTYLPIFNFYVENFILINVMTFGMLLLVNQFAPREEQTFGIDSFEEDDTNFPAIEEDTNFGAVGEDNIK